MELTVHVGQPAPDAAVEAWMPGEPQPRHTTLSAFHGRWLVLFFYPREFTVVCPTELQAFARLLPQFTREQAVVVGGPAPTATKPPGLVRV